MRLDLLLCRLRFAKGRAVAQRWIGEGHMRCNGERVTRCDTAIAVGDVLTLPVGRIVKLVAIDALPQRRGPAREAQTHYRELNRELGGSDSITAAKASNPKEQPPP